MLTHPAPLTTKYIYWTQPYISIYLEKTVPQQTVCDRINNGCALTGLILKSTVCQSP